MTPTNADITDVIEQAIRGEIPSLPMDPGWCLTLVRLVIERAFSWPSHHFYKWRTHPVERPGGADPVVPWARDMERSLRAAGMEVPGTRYGPPEDPSRYSRPHDLEPGDLLFRWDAAYPVGHVALYAGRGLVIENVDPANRPGAMTRGSTVLSRLGFWPITTAVRFDPYVEPATKEEA